MSVTVDFESSPIVTLQLSGKVSSREWLEAQRAVSTLLQDRKNIALLAIAKDFAGWGSGNWDDMSFRREHDHQIERLAIVADSKWEDLLLMFAGEGFRKFPIQHFEPARLAEARRWLSEKVPSAPGEPDQS